MPVIVDPEEVGLESLLDLSDFKGRRVLEIGCGRGRLTFGLAEHASHITAIDPVLEDIQAAELNTPDLLRGKINFMASTIADFALAGESRFDMAFFSWSL